ncbi:MAG: hypothetical protein HRT36_07115 [Alphaproteobacteria bacterium]|nr:hypothetical protein [Alphaproteobacteria bacterium]
MRSLTRICRRVINRHHLELARRFKKGIRESGTIHGGNHVKIPTIVLSGNPMVNSHYKGHCVGSGSILGQPLQHHG